ncbi:3-dehydroquinate synthase [Candidatus Margulisiibacteriota bacterium]
MPKVRVNLDENSYDINVGAGILGELGGILKKENNLEKLIVITDPLVNELWGSTLRSSLKSSGFSFEIIEIPRGERYKNLKIAYKLYDRLLKLEAHRDCCVIAFGGGVIGDLAGFVASTYMRGTYLVHVPTTLLAQVDASIGGKTSVNHPKGKNLIGVFYQPLFVCCDVEMLTSLPQKEIRTGLAEVIKYGVIEDEDFFKFLESNSHQLNTKAFEEKDTLKAALKVWQIIVTESCKIKARVVGQDEKERGLRMILNFGHTIGHAIETLTKYSSYTHGEAVAIGMVAAAMISKEMKMLDEDSVNRIKGLLEKLKLPTSVDGLYAKRIIRNLRVDKKIREGKIKFVLPKKIGKVEIRDDVPIQIVRKVLKSLGCK